MPDEPPLLRQWKLISLLSVRRHGTTIRELAREMKVGEKTIRRDLELFGQVGLPLEETRGARGCKTWRIAGDKAHPPLSFTFEEATALYLGRQLLEPLAGTPFWSAAHGAWRKVRATLGDSVRNYIDKFASMFHCTTFGQVDYADKSEVLDGLTMAIEERRVVHLTYRSSQATESATRDLYPLAWVRHRDALYLIAGGPDHGRPRTYKLDRMEALEVSPFVHQCYRDFNVEEFLAGSFGIYDGDGEIAVTIRFLPAAARYAAERTWHPSQVKTKHRDGGLTVQFRLSTTVEVKSWALGFGANAIVLEPESLRAEIAAELEQMLEAYAGITSKMLT